MMLALPLSLEHEWAHSNPKCNKTMISVTYEGRVLGLRSQTGCRWAEPSTQVVVLEQSDDGVLQESPGRVAAVKANATANGL